MIRTSIRHAPSCSQDEGVVRQAPERGQSFVVFKCRECGATATTDQVSR